MKKYKINEIENKRILGRAIENVGKENDLCLLWGSSALEINVCAKEVWVCLEQNYDTFENWVSVEVNGFQISRFIAPKEATWICISRGLNPENQNLISIIKDTQPMADEAHHALFIKGIALDDDGVFMSIKPRPLSFEFIGDSITSGEGLAGGAFEQDWITQWFCSSKSYAATVSKEFNADFSVISQCGWGLCWGWDGNENTNLYSHYQNVCSLLRGDYHKTLGAQKEYDFSKQNDWVIINLGTNDNSALNIENSNKNIENFYETAKSFLHIIRNKNKNAKILWTLGMISLDKIPSVVQKAILNYKKESSDENVFYLQLDSMSDLEKNDKDRGSRGHPGQITHDAAAKKIIEFIKNN